MYKAAVAFADLQDGNRRYFAGEKFPREGLVVSDERINELAGSDNRMGYPLIIKVAEEGETPVKAEESEKGLDEEKKLTPKPKKPRRKRGESDA